MLPLLFLIYPRVTMSNEVCMFALYVVWSVFSVISAVDVHQYNVKTLPWHTYIVFSQTVAL